MARRQSKDPLERYDTPRWVTRALVWGYPAGMMPGLKVIEPMAGAGAMCAVLRDECEYAVDAFDIKPRSNAVQQADTLLSSFWLQRRDRYDALITNGAFSANELLFEYGYVVAQIPLVALLVRLTWLEATKTRAHIPDPDAVIVLPRIKFIESPEAKEARLLRGGKWGGDSVTSCWAIWHRGELLPHHGVKRITPDMKLALGALERQRPVPTTTSSGVGFVKPPTFSG